jgi:hypothetical protein
MKKIVSILAFAAVVISACNSGTPKSEHEEHEMNNMNADTARHATATDEKEIKTVAVAFTNLAAGSASSIKSIVDNYLGIKNALANDNADDAAKSAKAMKEAIAGLDKSLLTAEQKKAYDPIEEELKEHAEHIGKNGDNISHQRSHFSGLSEVVYILVKNFGAGRPLYHDHCPMARDNQGAMWLNEAKEIRNPYFGAQMLTCGTVEELIQ